MAETTGITIKVDATPLRKALLRVRQQVAALQRASVAVSLLGTIDDAIAHFEIYAAHGEECHAGPLAIRATLIRRRREILEGEARALGYAEPEHVVHVLRGELVPDCADCVGDMDEKP